jgi:chromosome segregation ATPase
MKLKRLRIEQLRQFHQPLEIRDFESGINLFTGPNESGKSSIVRAIRAAFFERHRSSGVDDLLPWGDSAASPTVELDFVVGDTIYSLTKSFLHRKRCELIIGTQKFEGPEAEDRIAELLGFQFAAKGASKPEHWGIPGLLWIEQGSGQQVREAVDYATDHLRSALNDSLGQVASSGGEEVLERVRAERAMLLTGTGKPTGQLSKVATELADALTRKTSLEEQIATYRQQVDSLGNLRQQHAIEEAERPWDRLRDEMKVAEEKHANIQRLNQNLTHDRNQLAQSEITLRLLRQQLADFENQVQGLASRELALVRAMESVEIATAAHASLAGRQQAADAAYQKAREDLRLARQEDQRSTLMGRIQDAQPRLSALEHAITAAQSAQAQRVVFRKLAAASKIDKPDLATLQKQHKELREVEIRKTAIATRLEFDLEPGRSLILNGESISGQSERMLVAAGELGIPGMGRMTITPGGSDLAELSRKQSELHEAHNSLLQRINVASLEEAEQRNANYQQQLLDIRQAEQALALHAPKGLDALLAEQGEINVRIVEAQAALAKLPDVPEAPVLTQQQAEGRHEDARATLDAIHQEVNNAKQALASAEADRDSAKRERDAMHQSLQDPARQRRQQEVNQSLLDTNAERSALAERIDTQAQQIAEARPDILAQDVERLRCSADQTEREFHRQTEEIIRLQTQLEATGAQGSEEQAAELAAQVERLERRHTELLRRAKALDRLLGLLEDKRHELTRRLQAPLQKHLNRYLNLLFPQANLEIDENLKPGPLTRPGERGQESGEFEALSFGAREQMGLICRLAYADLLTDAGRPTLIILDDALVHSDEQRLPQMKRILFDAAQRHQILLFTCHPAAWRDLGVAPRSIGSLKSAAQPEGKSQKAIPSIVVKDQ